MLKFFKEYAECVESFIPGNEYAEKKYFRNCHMFLTNFQHISYIISAPPKISVSALSAHSLHNLSTFLKKIQQIFQLIP